VEYKNLGREHPEFASALMNAGMVHESQGRYEKALQVYSVALEARRRTLGAAHPTCGDTLYSMAEVYCSQGKSDLARKAYGSAGSVYSTAYGDEHEETLDARKMAAGLRTPRVHA
jgi:tetratricopeptide (TPR) repeat protein